MFPYRGKNFFFFIFCYQITIYIDKDMKELYEKIR